MTCHICGKDMAGQEWSIPVRAGTGRIWICSMGCWDEWERRPVASARDSGHPGT